MIQDTSGHLTSCGIRRLRYLIGSIWQEIRIFLDGKNFAGNLVLMQLIFEGKNLEGKYVLMQHIFGGKIRRENDRVYYLNYAVVARGYF